MVELMGFSPINLFPLFCIKNFKNNKIKTKRGVGGVIGEVGGESEGGGGVDEWWLKKLYDLVYCWVESIQSVLAVSIIVHTYSFILTTTLLSL